MVTIAVDGLSARAGGGGIYLRNQISSLARLKPDWDFLVFCVEENQEFVRLEAPNVVFQTVRFASHSLLKRVIWQFVKLGERLNGIDLLYCPGGFIIPGIAKPQVVTLQNPNPFASMALQPTAKLKIKRYIQRRWSIWSIYHADQTVFISKGHKKSVAKFMSLDNVNHHIIYNGLAPCFNEQLSSKNIEFENLPDQYVLSVSNFRRHKNYEALFRAFQYLDDFSDLYLVIAGRASDREYYREMKRLLGNLSLGERVVLLGFVENSHLPQLYSDAACYISTSMLEAFGLTPIEAMSQGVPVAISNRSVFPEICGEAALYFDPTDPKDIANKIRTILVDNERAEELRKSGYRRASRFSWDRNAEALLKVFKQVLSR